VLVAELPDDRLRVAQVRPGHAREQVVGAFRAEDLPVSGVVADEPDPGEHHRQDRGDSELPPRIAQQNEGRPRRGEQPPVMAIFAQ
jgi:hypothetical protein